MADFCNGCSQSIFGFQFGDLAGITTHEAWENGKAAIVTCEGCGHIQVDPYGNCVSPNCLRAGEPGHNLPWKKGGPKSRRVSMSARILRTFRRKATHLLRNVRSKLERTGDRLGKAHNRKRMTWGEAESEESELRLTDTIRTLPLKNDLNSSRDLPKGEEEDAGRATEEPEGDTKVTETKPHLSSALEYIYKHYALHLSMAGKHEDLRALLLNLAWLEEKLLNTGVGPVLQDFRYAPPDPILPQVRASLELSQHVLAHYPNQLRTQVIARLPRRTRSALRGLEEGTMRCKVGPWFRLLTDSISPVGGALTRTLEGHKSVVEFLVLLPETSHALSSSRDRTIILWDLATGSKLRTVTQHRTRIMQLAVSPDGNKCISVSQDGTLKVNRIKASKKAVTLTGHVCFSLLSDGLRVVSGLSSGEVVLWKLSTGEEELRLQAHDERVVRVAATQDGRRLVSVSQTGKYLSWDLVSRQRLVELSGPDFVPERLSVIGKDDTVIAERGETLRVWDLTSGRDRISSSTHECVTSSPDGGNIVLGFSNGSVSVLSSQTGTLRDSFVAHSGAVEKVLVTRSGECIVTSSSAGIKVWDMTTNPQSLLFEDRSRAWKPQAIVWEDRAVLCAADLGHRSKELAVWDLATGKKTNAFIDHGYFETILESSFPFLLTDKLLVTATFEGALRVWDLESATTASAFKAHRTRVVAAGFTEDGRSAVTEAEDGSITTWYLTVGKKRELKRQEVEEKEAVKLKSQHALASKRAEKVKIWSMANSKQIIAFSKRSITKKPIAIARRENRKLNDATIWDTKTGKSLLSLKKYGIWKIAGGESFAAALTSYGDKAIVGFGTGVAAVWDVSKREVEFHGWFHNAPITALAVTPDDHYALSGAADGSLSVWHLGGNRRSWEELMSSEHQAPIVNITVEDDCESFSSRSLDDEVKYWNLPPDRTEAKVTWCDLPPDRPEASENIPLVGELHHVNVGGNRCLVISAGKSIELMKSETCRTIASFSAEEDITAWTISADAKKLVCGDASGGVHVLTLENPDCR